MSWLDTWFGYGLGRGAAEAVFGEHRAEAAQPPIRRQTESEILADERRYDEDARRLAAQVSGPDQTTEIFATGEHPAGVEALMPRPPRRRPSEDSCSS
jgi:hypothetical protein